MGTASCGPRGRDMRLGPYDQAQILLDALRADNLELRYHGPMRYGFLPDGTHTYAPPRVAVMAKLPGVRVTIHNVQVLEEAQEEGLLA